MLVVDDEPSILELLSAYLRMRGHDVLLAGDGEEALRLLSEHPVDVVLADVRMPRMGGLELLERVRDLNHPTAFVLMTGYGSIEAAVSALRNGARDYLLKPLKLREVNTALLDAVEQVRVERDAARLGQLPALYEDIRSSTPATIARLYRRLCEHTARDVEAAGAMVALYEPAERRWREQFRTPRAPFGGLDADRLGEHLRSGGVVEDDALFWFGPGSAALRVEPLFAQLDPRSPSQVVGFLALANPRADSSAQLGPQVYAHAVGAALSRHALSSRRTDGPALGAETDPDEHLRRVEALLDAPARTMRLPDAELAATRRALHLWVSGLAVDEMLNRSGDADRSREIFLALPERYGGSGSPRGLAGKAIPPAASLLAVALWWDLVTRATLAHLPLGAEPARAVLEAAAGRCFDPVVASIFLRAHLPTARSEETLHPDDEPSGGHWLDLARSKL